MQIVISVPMKSEDLYMGLDFFQVMTSSQARLPKRRRTSASIQQRAEILISL